LHLLVVQLFDPLFDLTFQNLILFYKETTPQVNDLVPDLNVLGETWIDRTLSGTGSI
jgi:hypothetical protein